MHRLVRPAGGMIAALALAAPLAAPTTAPAASAPQPDSWTKLLDRPLSAKELGQPATAPARSLARAALRHSAKPLKLRGSLRGLQLLPEARAPKLAGARDLRTLRFRQTVGGLRVLYSQIDVAVVEGSVTSISATTIPLTSTRLRGAERVSAQRARAIARRRIAGPDSALPAQPIAYAGKPAKPRAPRRAWVVQVTPQRAASHDEEDLNLCVVLDAQSGKVLDVWKGVAARPISARPAGAQAAPGARLAQATEHNLFRIRDANFVPGTIGTNSFILATTGNPYSYGEDVEFYSAHNFPPGAGILPDAGKLSIDLQFLPKHMCHVRGYCGRDGGFDGTFNEFRITARAPAQSNPPQNDRGTRYVHSQQRVYMDTSDAGSGDILAHELGHLMDFTYGEDRIANLFTDEVEEAIADMFAYDYDRNDATLGESEPGFTGNPLINWANPRAITNPVENEPYPAHARQFKCIRTDVHFNGTIDSHAYFKFVQKLGPDGHDTAGAVLHRVSSVLGPFPSFQTLRDSFIQRAGELFGTSTRNAAIAAWSEVGRAPGNEVISQHPTCPRT